MFLEQEQSGRKAVGGAWPGFLSPGRLAPPSSRVSSHILDLFAWPQAAPCLPRLPRLPPGSLGL